MNKLDPEELQLLLQLPREPDYASFAKYEAFNNRPVPFDQLVMGQWYVIHQGPAETFPLIQILAKKVENGLTVYYGRAHSRDFDVDTYRTPNIFFILHDVPGHKYHPLTQANLDRVSRYLEPSAIPYPIKNSIPEISQILIDGVIQKAKPYYGAERENIYQKIIRPKLSKTNSSSSSSSSSAASQPTNNTKKGGLRKNKKTKKAKRKTRKH